MTSPTLRLFRVADRTLRATPLPVATAVVQGLAARLGPRLMPAKARLLDRHLSRVVESGPYVGPVRGPSVARGFGSYGRYWAESIALPHLPLDEIDRGFSFVGYDRIEDVRATGRGPILVLPHLGGWEWAAAWLGRVAGVPVTAVVESLEPADVFDWFRRLRTSYGVNVVPLGPDAFGQVTSAVRDGHVVCLLADRDIGGTGVEVEFFGARTTLPIGPAVVSTRTGAPVLPTAVYFDGSQRVTMVGAPVDPNEVDTPTSTTTWPSGGSDDDPGPAPSGGGLPVTGGRRPRGRKRYRLLTQRYARELERLIAAAPAQWHLLEPNWPSDPDL